MSHAVITARISAVMGAMALLVMVQSAEAQQPNPAFKPATNAALKMQQQHKQTGSVGGGYRPYSAWTYQNSAQTHARTLSAYGQNCKQLPPATAKEHLGAIRQNVTATRTEIAKLGPEAAKEADVKQHVDAMEKHLAECEKLCGMMEKTIGKDGVETAQMCAHCSGLQEKLKAVEGEHRALLKKLGIEPPVPAGDHAEHQHRKSDAGATKKD